MKDMEHRMEKTLETLRHELAGIRTGKATTALLDTVRVEVYGTTMPLNQVATVTAPEARLLVVQPWDRKSLHEVEKAIMKANLGLNPSNDGTVIRLPIPPLNEERRRDIVRLVKKMGEEAKVALRNVRRDVVETVKKMEKSGEVPEDEGKKREQTIQKTTDRFVAEVDALLKRKEDEVLEV
jgi:ribosome recycling factor